MIIRDLYIQHFGKFHDRHIRLEPGINVVYGDNEAGKSTLTVFIEAMFFGVERSRGTAARKDMYSRYQPWEGGRNYEGRMTVEADGDVFRLSRNFYKEDPSFTVEHMGSGKKVALADERVDDLFEGMTRPNFRNTLCVGQLAGRPDDRYGLSFQAQMAQASHTGAMNVDLQGALDYLKKERRAHDTKTLREQLQAVSERLESTTVILDAETYERDRARLTEQLQENERRTRALDRSGREERQREWKQRVEAARLLEENNQLAEAYRQKKARYDALGEQTEGPAFQTARKQWREARDAYNQSYEKLSGRTGRDLAIVFSVMMFGLLLLMAVFFLKNSTVYRLGACGFFAAVLFSCAALLSAGRRSLKRRTEQAREAMAYYQERMESAMSGNETEKERDRLRRDMRGLKERYDAIQEPLQRYLDMYGEDLSMDEDTPEQDQALDDLRAKREELIKKREQLDARKEWADRAEADRAALEEEMAALQEKIGQAEEKRGIVDDCIQIFQSLSEEIHGDFGQELDRRVSDIFCRMTDGKYLSVRVDEQLGIQVDDGHRFVEMDQLSQGTQDQLCLSLRLGMIHLLFGGRPMPVILDDTFASFDDSRMAETLHWLGHETGLQIILMTCHHREAAALRAMGMDGHFVEL